MEKNDAVRAVLERHVPTGSRQPPTPVYSAVASLNIDPGDLKWSWTTFATNGQTTWICWVVSSTALAYVEVEFGTAMYDAAEEKSRGRQRINAASTTITQAWKRPLAGVVELRVGCPQGDDVRLRFVDEKIILQKRPLGNGDGPQRFENFLASIHAALPF
jgi:hypothetical protein